MGITKKTDLSPGIDQMTNIAAMFFKFLDVVDVGITSNALFSGY